MDSDEARVREVIQARADDVEKPAHRLARLRGAVARLDREPSLISAARRFRRRLPGDEKFGDPLSTAGRGPVEVIARGVTALQPRRESVAKELGLSALQVWQSVSEAAGGGDYLGVDVNVAARVGAAARGQQVVVSDALLAQIDRNDLRTGRAKRLRADGAPSGLRVISVSRA